MNQSGEHAAELCIAELKDRGCDFSLLFWLRNPEMLAGSPFGNDMIIFMEKDMKIDSCSAWRRPSRSSSPT